MIGRITMSKSRDGELEIWVNEAGRDKLVRELGRLTRENDHFHLGASEAGAEVNLQMRAYRDDDQVIDAAKVMLRPDDWDARYFPHVLDPSIVSTDEKA